MTRAERRRLEKLTGCKQAVYQYTAAQIEEIKRQAVQEQKQYLDKVIDEEWKKRTEAVSGETEEERMKKVLGLLLSVPARMRLTVPKTVTSLNKPLKILISHNHQDKQRQMKKKRLKLLQAVKS